MSRKSSQAFQSTKPDFFLKYCDGGIMLLSLSLSCHISSIFLLSVSNESISNWLLLLLTYHNLYLVREASAVSYFVYRLPMHTRHVFVGVR